MTHNPETGLSESVQHNSRHQPMTPVSWQPDRRLDLPEWIRQGRRLGSIGRGAAWWIGDWVNYGTEKFGKKYSRAARITGYDVQSLMNMAYVAARFQISRRREDLSWSHHAELAPLPVEHQDRWLVLAAERRLSVRGLRDELRTWRARTGPTDTVTDVGEPQSVRADEGCCVVCPRCGYELDTAGTEDSIRTSEPVPSPCP